VNATRCLVAVALLAGVPWVSDAQPVPDSGLAAEIAGRWDEALRVYRNVLDREPQRVDLWLRVADIEAAQGQLSAAVAAAERAAQAQPGDAVVYRRLSQAYALSQQPDAALRAIEAALAIEPDNPDDLRARAVLATWCGDYRRAQRSYRRLTELEPSDVGVSLSLARVSAWAGDLGEAVERYHRHLASRPDEEDVWLELARVESWRGDYAAARETIGIYRDRFGESGAYWPELAAALARGGRPARALSIIAPLLDQDPSSYDLNLIRTTALMMQHRRREARASLGTVRRLDPSRKETHSAEALLRTLLGSEATLGISAYADSDRLSVTRFAPSASVWIASGTALSAGYEHDLLEAPRTNGLGRVGRP